MFEVCSQIIQCHGQGHGQGLRLQSEWRLGQGAITTCSSRQPALLAPMPRHAPAAFGAGCAAPGPAMPCQATGNAPEAPPAPGPAPRKSKEKSLGLVEHAGLASLNEQHFASRPLPFGCGS